MPSLSKAKMGGRLAHTIQQFLGQDLGPGISAAPLGRDFEQVRFEREFSYTVFSHSLFHAYSSAWTVRNSQAERVSKTPGAIFLFPTMSAWLAFGKTFNL